MRRLLGNRDFLLLWTGQTLSGFGSWISFVGLNLYVYELFGSGKVLGTFLLVRMLPALFFGPLGGLLADRFPRRRLLIACDAARAALVLGFLFTRSLPAFFALGLLLSAIDKVFAAAHGAFLPSLVEREDLLEANAATKMSQSVVTVLGPAAGGLLVAAFSYPAVFVIDSASFLVSVATLLFMSDGRAAEPAREGEGPGLAPVWAFFGARAGLLFLTGVRLMDGLGSGSYNTALPVFSKTLVLARGAAYGWLVGAWALGEFAGAFAVRRLQRALPFERETLFAAAVALMACGMGLTFRCETLAAALVLIFVGGVGDGMSNVIFNTTLMQESPDALRGRILGSVIAVVYGFVALGMAVAGFVLDRWPLQTATDLSTAFILAGTLMGAAFFRLRRTA